LREHLYVDLEIQPIIMADRMFELPTLASSIVLDIANVRAIILMKQDDDNTDWEISNDTTGDLGESILSSNIVEDNMDDQQEILHLDQVRHDKTKQTTRVSLP